MRVCAGLSGPLVLSLVLVLVRGWEADLELLDLVEEVSQNFYEFLHLDKDAAAADIKKAYRRLSLTLHPDKNKDENAETQFRQLVAIYEVLKDEDRRRRYDDILENGLPDWRQPVFYYRRVRKMSNAELGFLLFLILTVGHYAVIWSIYLEKQLDELLSRKKKEKKKKLSSRPAEELRYIGQDRSDRSHERPQWQDILPLKLSIWLYLALKNLPQTVQEVKRFYEDYRQTKQEAEAEQEVAPREKRPKVKKPKVEFPVYVPPETQQNYDQTTSIEDIEDQMDNWLQDAKAPKKKESGWTEDDLSLLSRLMVKFPGGTPGRWEKIAQELGRSVPAVTTKVKQMKDNVNQTLALVKLSDLKSPPLPVRSFPVDDIITQRVGGASEEEEEEEEEGEEEAALVLRRRKKKSSCTDGWEGKVRGRRQKDFDPAAAVEEQGEAELQENMAVWTQNQQKLLELALQQFPRGTTERWDRIAKVVPGKTKEDCVTRCKMLAELVKKRKQLKS